MVVGKSIDILGFTTTLGSVLFASTFLATDILSEKYSKEDAKKAIYMSVFSSLAFILITQIVLAFIPNKTDIVIVHAHKQKMEYYSALKRGLSFYMHKHS